MRKHGGSAAHACASQEVITYIEARLAELEGEKEELKAYQQLDRDKRALEYTLYDKELRKVSSRSLDLC